MAVRGGLRCGPVVFLALVLVPALPVGVANHLDASNLNAAHLVPLVHRPYPGDDLGVAYTESNATASWARLHYGVREAPTVWTDGRLAFEGLPRGEGGGPNVETLRAYERAYAASLVNATPATLALAAVLEPDALRSNAGFLFNRSQSPGELVVRIFLVEEELARPDGPSRLPVVRAGPQTLAAPARQERFNGTARFPLDPAWSTGRLAVVAALERVDGEGPGEVLQAALWRSGQSGATLQTGKAVLFELYTEPGCDACDPAERALEELARKYGPAASAEPAGYFRAPAAWQWALAAVGGLLLVAALRPRAGAPPREDPRGL